MPFATVVDAGKAMPDIVMVLELPLDGAGCEAAVPDLEQELIEIKRINPVIIAEACVLIFIKFICFV